MLLTSGRITKDQFRDSSIRLLDNPEKRHGQILVEMGLMTEEEMRAHVLEQIQRIVWSLFGVPEGRVTFTLGDFAADEIYRLRIPTPRAILHGCKTLAESKGLLTRLGSKNAVFGRLPTPDHLEGLDLEPGEEQLLQLVDGERTLYELCEQGPFSAGLNGRILYGLHVLGLIVLEREHAGGIKVQIPSGTSPS
jgi:hypothetical protein